MATRLFLPATAERAKQMVESEAAVVHAVEKLDFRQVATAGTDLYTATRGRIFQEYSHQAIVGRGDDGVPDGTDVWLLALIAAAIPLTGLAAFLGAKTASRRGNKSA